MNYESNGEGEGWTWQVPNSTFEDNTNTEVSRSFVSMSNQSEGHADWMFHDTTPLKACNGLSHHFAGNGVHRKEIEQNKEPHPQLKKRRVLHFEPDFLDIPNEMDLRSKEIEDTHEDSVADISDWVSLFADDTYLFSDEHLDPSAERFINDCFNNNETIFSINDMIASGPSDVITEPFSNSVEYDANVIEKLPIHTSQNITLKGKNSYMFIPPKLSSSIISPFTFIKPCGAHGDMTLKDINQRLHTPKSNQIKQDSSTLYPRSAFSGKPVVRKTKIRTGEGSITIVTTKG